MPNRESAPRVPSYRRHKPSGQAVVTLNGRDIYLGNWGTKAGKAEYERLIGQWPMTSWRPRQATCPTQGQAAACLVSLPLDHDGLQGCGP